jgi:hypothetical protein
MTTLDRRAFIVATTAGVAAPLTTFAQYIRAREAAQAVGGAASCGSLAPLGVSRWCRRGARPGASQGRVPQGVTTPARFMVRLTTEDHPVRHRQNSDRAAGEPGRRLIEPPARPPPADQAGRRARGAR